MCVFEGGVVLLLILFIVGLAMNHSQEEPAEVGISYGVSLFLFNGLSTSAVSYYTVFWEDMKQFATSTEPFVGLGRQQNNTAANTLLLDYSCSPTVVVIYTAMQRKHWKVFRTSLLALLQRILPIIVGGSITVTDLGDGRSSLRFSTSLFIIIIVWLAVYALLIPFEVLESDSSRYLPRCYSSIADLLSWTSSSDLLRRDCLETDTTESGATENPFNIYVDGGKTNNEMRAKWYMEARLGLLMKKYQFGLVKIANGENRYTMGIDFADNTTELSHVGQHRLFRKKREEADTSAPFCIAGAGHFAPVQNPEDINLQNMQLVQNPAIQNTNVQDT
jgi:hypothetical protein